MIAYPRKMLFMTSLTENGTPILVDVLGENKRIEGGLYIRYPTGGTDTTRPNFLFEIPAELTEENERLQARVAELESANSDEWIKRSERLPEESDGDCDGTLWVYDKALSKVEISDAADVNFIADYTHWMPTDLVRPEPPQEQGRGDKNDKN